MKNQNSASPYSPGSFHTARAFMWLSTVIVTGILIDFIVHLHADGFKVPYAFLLIMITCALTFVSLVFTTLLYARNSLRPVISLAINVTLFILWIISIGFLGYSMRGTLNISCNLNGWGTSTGVMVCRLYKTLFSFAVIATVFTLFHAGIDGVARKDQAILFGLTAYDSMGNQGQEYKMHTRNESTIPLANTGAGGGGGYDESRSDTETTRADAYNALGTVRQDDTQRQQQRHHHLQPVSQDAEYYDGVPDIPPASGVRWASSAAMRQTSYSPLHSRFDEQQTEYEAYRHQRPMYDQGNYRGYGYRN